MLVPANRFEVLECRAALDAVAENAQDTPPLRTGALDVLAQHILGCACGAPFLADELYAEVRAPRLMPRLRAPTSTPRSISSPPAAMRSKAYERFAKIRQGKDGRWRITHPRVAQRYRMNVGTIVEADMLKVRLVRSRALGKMIPRGGRLLGEVEEYFIETLTPGDTFVFAGEILQYEALVEDEVYVSRHRRRSEGAVLRGRQVSALDLSRRPRARHARRPESLARAAATQVREWLEIQEWRSLLPRAGDLLVETFPRAGKYYLVCYPFEGRLAHQTLGMLLTRRLERARLRPLGFVANEYALAVWGLGDVALRIARGELTLARLFDEDMLGDDLEAWLAESALMKRTFRTCAIIAGLIERRFPGKEKSRRQVTISTDLIYDVLRRHEPDHILLRAARADAATGLLDIERLGEMLSRIKGRIVHKGARPRLAARRAGDAGDRPRAGLWRGGEALLAEAADELVREAMQLRTGAHIGTSTGRREVPSAGDRGDFGRRPPTREAGKRAMKSPCRRRPARRPCRRPLLARARPARVADLHLEKGSSFAARGQLLPPYDTAATLARLRGLIAHYAPRAVIALGDSFHDGGGPARIDEADRATCAALQRGRDWIWIAGNHDPEPAEDIGGVFQHDSPRRAHLPPSAGRRRRRNRRPSASGRARGPSRPHGARRCFAADDTAW